VPDPVQPSGHVLEICPIFSHPVKIDGAGRVTQWHEEPCRRERCMFYRRRDGACTLTFVAEAVEDVAALKDEHRRTAEELERVVSDLARRAEVGARQVGDAVRGELAVGMRQVTEDLQEVKRTTGSLETGAGESRAALVELVEYDRQRRRREEAERERLEKEQRRAKAADLNRIGCGHHRAGRREESIEALSEARRLDADSPEILSNLGAALLGAGRLDPAEEPLRRAVRLSDSFASARANLGHLLLLRGRAEEALEVLEQAVKLDPSSGAAWNSLGNARWRLGEYPAAVEAWHRAWRNDPLREEAFRNLVRQQEEA